MESSGNETSADGRFDAEKARPLPEHDKPDEERALTGFRVRALPDAADSCP
jgi:hypothetical protein